MSMESNSSQYVNFLRKIPEMGLDQVAAVKILNYQLIDVVGEVSLKTISRF